MARYVVSIDSSRTAEEAFAYLSAFDNIRDWDPSVVFARRLDEGSLSVGSTFEVVVRQGSKETPLRYEVQAIEQGGSITVEAIASSYRSLDVITVVGHGAGSTVTYDALLEPRGLLRLATPLVNRAFKRLAEDARRGLERVLNPV